MDQPLRVAIRAVRFRIVAMMQEGIAAAISVS